MNGDQVEMPSEARVEVPKISMETRKAYLQDVARLASGRVRVGSKATHYRLRAALIWYHAESAEYLRDALEAEGSSPDPMLREELDQHLAAWAAWAPGKSVDANNEQQDRLAGYLGARGIGNNKRRGLGTLPANWRDQLVNAASPGERPFLLILALSGCRPSELARGVRVDRDTEGLTLTIEGSKVTARNGQAQRRLRLDANHLWSVGLEDLLPGEAGCEIYRISPSRLAHVLERLARQAWAPASSKKGYRISAYSFRHQLAADLKACETPAALIAAILGHRSERTQSCYGHARQGRGGGISPIVTAAVTHLPRTHASSYTQAQPKDATHRIVTVLRPITTRGGASTPQRPNRVTPGSRPGGGMG